MFFPFVPVLRSLFSFARRTSLSVQAGHPGLPTPPTLAGSTGFRIRAKALSGAFFSASGVFPLSGRRFVRNREKIH